MPQGIKMQRYLAAIMMLGLSALLPGSAGACSVPVFRYALERWPADCYEAVLIHRGDIAENDPAVSLLQGQTAEFLNLHLSKIDLGVEDVPPSERGQDARDTAQEQVKSLLGGEIPEKLPALALWYPRHKGRAAPFWKGQFTPEVVSALLQSPKRKELAERLTKGQSAVWVFIESGNADKDKAALDLLSQELETATRELKEQMPSIIDESDLSGMPGLSFEFSTLTVSRSDQKERFLLAALLNSEPDLQQYAGEPILFPVFGRGRALYALVGQGINAENIRDAVGFLTGPCGCEIKMLNPGVDLLMAVNWDAAVMQFYQEFYETQEAQMELTSAFPQAPAEVSTTANSSGSFDGPTADFKSKIENRKSKIHRFGVLGTAAASLGVILAVAALGTFAVIRKRHS
jgi:hypothetical protein